jgi:hypothetical protein
MSVDSITNPTLVHQLHLRQLLLLLLQQEAQQQGHVQQPPNEYRPGGLLPPLLPAAILTSIDINDFQQSQQQPPTVEFPVGRIDNLSFDDTNGTFAPAANPEHLFSGEAQRGHTPLRPQSERAMFFLVVRALFKILEIQKRKDTFPTDDLNWLTRRVKRVLSIGMRRNRAGDARFIPLHVALEPLLRQAVGDVYWRQAVDIAHRYWASKGMSFR